MKASFRFAMLAIFLISCSYSESSWLNSVSIGSQRTLASVMGKNVKSVVIFNGNMKSTEINSLIPNFSLNEIPDVFSTMFVMELDDNTLKVFSENSYREDVKIEIDRTLLGKRWLPEQVLLSRPQLAEFLIQLKN